MDMDVKKFVIVRITPHAATLMARASVNLDGPGECVKKNVLRDPSGATAPVHVLAEMEGIVIT